LVVANKLSGKGYKVLVVEFVGLFLILVFSLTRTGTELGEMPKTKSTS
jgi:hypothetical protein